MDPALAIGIGMQSGSVGAGCFSKHDECCPPLGARLANERKLKEKEERKGS